MNVIALAKPGCFINYLNLPTFKDLTRSVQITSCRNPNALIILGFDLDFYNHCWTLWFI